MYPFFDTTKPLILCLLCFILISSIIFSFDLSSSTIESRQVKAYAQQFEPESEEEVGTNSNSTQGPPPEQPEPLQPQPQNQPEPQQQPEERTGEQSAPEQSQSQDGGSGAGGGGGGCLIATAAFGSDLSPQVQFLRNFRDNHILSTASGSSFMNVFNAWYYSFSPHVANYERANPWFQQTVKISIYPLLGILQLSEKSYWYMDDEYGSLTAGLVASSLIGSIYLSPFLLLSRRIRKTDLDKKFVLAAMASVVLAVLAVFGSMSYTNETALMITTSILVLTTIAVSSIFAARGLVYVGKLIQRTKSEFLSIH